MHQSVDDFPPGHTARDTECENIFQGHSCRVIALTASDHLTAHVVCVWSFTGDLASDDEYLEIPSISRQRAGTYECSAVNEIDTDAQTVDITVNCESAAELKKHIVYELERRLVHLSISLLTQINTQYMFLWSCCYLKDNHPKGSRYFDMNFCCLT